MECNPITGECTDCPEGYYLDNGKCVKCDEENEMNCAVNSCFTKEKKCKKCANGYYISNNTCYQCH